MRRWAFVVVIVMLPVGSGCKYCCNKRPFGGLFSREPSRLGSPAPVTDPLLIPPPAGGLPTPSADAPPPPPSRGAPDLPPPSLPESRSYSPEKKNGRELHLPDPLPGDSSSKRSGFLEDPATVKGSPSTSNAQPRAMAPAKTYSGVPGFVLVSDGIATGRKPTLEGFDTLKQAGYKTVVYLHAADADVAAVKALAEKRGFTFAAIAISTDSLKPAASRAAEILGDSATRPLYVFDDTGLYTGSLWYIYFRTVEGLSDDAAQVRAGPLGLRDAPPAEKDKFWPAVQDYILKR